MSTEGYLGVDDFSPLQSPSSVPETQDRVRQQPHLFEPSALLMATNVISMSSCTPLTYIYKYLYCLTKRVKQLQIYKHSAVSSYTPQLYHRSMLPLLRGELVSMVDTFLQTNINAAMNGQTYGAQSHLVLDYQQ